MSKTGLLITIGLIGLLVFGIYSSQKTAKVEANSIILYYGDTCPHCKDVEEYIEANKIDDKLSIIRKEVYQNQGNALQLNQKAKECGLPTDQGIGVPFLYAEGKCYLGTPDIEKYLTEKAGLIVPTETPVATEAGEIVN